MSSVKKFCTDHLRAFCQNRGVKLKSAHAHELVAAFFGYKSNAAMLADTLSPIETLAQAQFIVLTPSLFIDQRRKCLEDLPPDLPDTPILGEELFTCLISEGWFSGKSFGAWKHFVDISTTDYLLKHGSSILSIPFGKNEIAHSSFDKPVYEYNPVLDATDNKVKLVVTNLIYASNDINSQSIDITATIKLRRVAGHVGYSDHEISIIDNSKVN